MAVKIRLQRHGRRKAPFYHIVIADSRSPRDGRFLERIGSYNPLTKPATIELDRDKAFEWIQRGAQPTETVNAILSFKGVLFRTHLQRGVSKGALTQEAADAQYAAWVEAKEAKIAGRREQTQKEMADLQKKIFGTPRPKKVVEVPIIEDVAVEDAPMDEAPEVVAEDAAPEAPATEE